MFKIKGSDGNEYGPVSADVICQWIGERRAGAQTRIQAEGSTEWKTLSELPEFAAALAAQPSSAPSAGPPLLARAAQPRPSQTSGLAIASLVLGILGICSGGLTAIPGLVLGLVALSKINRSEGRLGGKGLAIAGNCVSGAFLLLLPAMLWPALAKAKQKAQTIQCVNHLKQLGLAVRLYAEDNNGQYPTAANWCDALVTNLSDVKVLQCPARSSPRCGYAMNRAVAGRTLSTVPPDTVMLFESAGGWNITGGQGDLLSQSPHGRTYGIGFADGSVRQLTQAELPTLRWEP